MFVRLLHGPSAVLAGPAGHLTDERRDVELQPRLRQPTLSTEGKAFIRKCGEAWGEAHVASGANPEEARAQAERTIAFYTGT